MWRKWSPLTSTGTSAGAPSAARSGTRPPHTYNVIVMDYSDNSGETFNIWQCTTCCYREWEQPEINDDEHNWVWYNNDDISHFQYCDICGEILTDTEAAHDWQIEVTEPATCTQNALVTASCPTCGRGGHPADGRGAEGAQRGGVHRHRA